jgi:hypothetical protein
VMEPVGLSTDSIGELVGLPAGWLACWQLVG